MKTTTAVRPAQISYNGKIHNVVGEDRFSTGLFYILQSRFSGGANFAVPAQLCHVIGAPQSAKHADDVLLAIAKEHLDLETLETRNGDSLDFSDQAVWGIRAALAAAFAAGMVAAQKALDESTSMSVVRADGRRVRVSVPK